MVPTTEFPLCSMVMATGATGDARNDYWEMVLYVVKSSAIRLGVSNGFSVMCSLVLALLATWKDIEVLEVGAA